jgi:AbrB family looped-hinge helix DNA binding protein
MQVVPITKDAEMKEFTSSISPKGQITLPLEVRKLLGVKPKDKVLITLEGEEVRVTVAPLRRLEESFQAVPALREPRTLEEIVEIAHEEQAQEAAKEGLAQRT